MRSATFQLKCFLFAGAVAALLGCGNAEKAAEKAIAKANADWTGARDDLDPEKRVKAYDGVIKDVEAVGKKYKKTAYGQAIANGGAAGGLSVSSMKAERDNLAARAACYSNPTTDCLRPFASQSFRDNAGYEGSPEAAFGESQTLVCDKGFAAADRSLESFKINKQLYAQQLVQVAMAASQCDRPDDVKAAVNAYIEAEPAQGPERMGALLSILATDNLQAGWAPVLAQFETILPTGALDQNSAANVALTMAVNYAKLGDTKAAQEKYAYFEQLGYAADWQSKMNLAGSFVIGGAAEEGMKLTSRSNEQVIVLRKAAEEVGLDLDLVRQGTGVPELINVQDIKDYMAPVEGSTKAKASSAAGNIEKEVDKLAQTVTVQDGAIGMSGLDAAYGILALIHQKLGDSGKASAAIDKARALRGKLLAPGAESVGEQEMAAYSSLIALAQGKPEEAAMQAKVMHVKHDHARLIVKEVAAKGDAEKALAVANEMQVPGNWNLYSQLVEGLAGAGKTDEAEAVINAYPGSADEKAGLQWLLVQRLANEGDIKGAEKAAEKYGILNTPADRLRLKTVMLNSEKVLKDRGKAEPIIRDIFAAGEETDKVSDTYYAQNAAEFAFKGGHRELGIELYKAATRKDQRPLFAAFTDDIKPREMTPIFMLAQDNLYGEELGYVIDAGIRRLEKAGS